MPEEMVEEYDTDFIAMGDFLLVVNSYQYPTNEIITRLAVPIARRVSGHNER